MNSILNILAKPLQISAVTRDDSDEYRLVANLQGNILKAHRCPFVVHLFVNFRDGAAAKGCLNEMASRRAWPISTALEQIRGVAWVSDEHPEVVPFISVMLSRSGYEKLGIDDNDIPADAAFRTGMQIRGPMWIGDDPAFKGWDEHFKQMDEEGQFVEQKAIHAMIMVGGQGTDTLAKRVVEFEGYLRSHNIVTVGREVGTQLLRKKPNSSNGEEEPFEHFGFVDNISVSVFLDRGEGAQL